MAHHVTANKPRRRPVPITLAREVALAGVLVVTTSLGCGSDSDADACDSGCAGAPSGAGASGATAAGHTSGEGGAPGGGDTGSNDGSGTPGEGGAASGQAGSGGAAGTAGGSGGASGSASGGASGGASGASNGRQLGGTSDVNDLTAYPKTLPPPGPAPIPTCALTLTAGQDVQGAIDANPEGTVVCLSPGTWTGGMIEVKPKKGDSIYGAGAGTTILNGIAIRGGPGLDNVTVANLTLTGLLTGQGVSDPKVYQSLGAIDSNVRSDQSHGWHILNNEIYGCNSGILAGSGSVVTNNYVHDNYEEGIGGGGTGTLFQYNASIHNAATDYVDSGNKSGDEQGVTWANNYFADSGFSGLWCDVWCKNAHYTSNVLVRNAFVGIMSEIDNGANVFEGNLAGGNGPPAGNAYWGSAGILLSTSGNDTVKGNYVWSNSSPDGDIVLWYDTSRNWSNYGHNTVTGNVTSVAIKPGNATDTVSGNTVVPAAQMQVPKVVAGPQR